MKKLLVLLLAITLCFSMVACGDSSSSEPKQGDLKKAVSLIKDAEEIAVSMGNIEVSHWDVDWNLMMNALFTDDGYERFMETSYSDSIKKDIEKCYQGRRNAKAKLAEAREIIATGGSGEEYQAVKEYYSEVSAFVTFVSNFPEGYSENTFTTALAEYKKDCQTAYSETQLY